MKKILIALALMLEIFSVSQAEAREAFAYSAGSANYYVDLDRSRASGTVSSKSFTWIAIMIPRASSMATGEMIDEEYIFSCEPLGSRIVYQKNVRLNGIGYSSSYTTGYVSNDARAKRVFDIIAANFDYVSQNPAREYEKQRSNAKRAADKADDEYAEENRRRAEQ